MANIDDEFSKKGTEESAKQVQNARTLKEEYKELLGVKTKLNEYDRIAISLADKVTQSAQQNVVELGRSNSLQKEIQKDARLLLDLERERLLATKNLSSSQVADAEKLANANIKRISLLDQIEEIQDYLQTADEIQYNLGLKEIDRIQNELAIQEQLSNEILKQENLDVQRLALAIQSSDQQRKNIGLKEKENNVQEEINKKLGVAGNSLKFVSSVLGEAAKGFKLDKVANDMQQFTDEAVRAGKPVGRLQVLGVGIKSAFSNLKATLTDPSVIIGSMVKGWQDIDKANKEFRQLTGQNVGALEQMNLSLISGVDYIKTAVKLSKELGVNARVAFSKETLTEAAELTELMGLGAKEAGRLATLSKVTGTELKSTTKSLETNFQSFVKTNKTALNFGDIINDVGGASAALSISLGSSPKKIAEAAMEARKLGINLEQADKIAESLLNFESSIEAELEAELLTGKDLNLEKARLAALNNDIATLSKEIGKNEQINQAFSSGNRIQQEAIAKSIGMSRDDMAKMIYQQKIQNGLSAEQASKAADISLEEAKRQTAQEQINKAIEKFTQLLGLILTPINYILSNSVALGTVFTVLAIATFPKIISGVKGLASGLKDSLSTTKDLAKGIVGLFKKDTRQEAKDKIKGILGGADKTKEMADKAGDGVGAAADKSKNVSPQSGKAIKDFLTNLSKGIQSFSAVKPGDILKLAGSALALVALTPAIPALLLLQLVKGPLIKSALKGIADGLVAFGKSAQGLTKVAPYIVLAELLIAGFGAALIPLTYALSKLSPLIEAFGKVVGEVFKGIAGIVTAVADGFTKLMNAITLEKAAALIALGAGFTSLAVGLGTFAVAVAGAGIASFFASGGIISQVEKLASLSGPLTTTAGALSQIASALNGVSSALGQIDTKKLEALNNFGRSNSIRGAVSGIINTITAPIKSLGETAGKDKGDKSSSELAEIKAVLQQILAKESHIYMDSTKVGTGFAMGTSKVQ